MLLLLLSLAAFSEVAFDAAVTDADWDVTAERQGQPVDAVILADHTVFLPTEIKRYRKVRILNDNGMAAAEIAERTRKIIGLKGRVVDRASGRRTIVEKERDLVTIQAYRTRGERTRTRIVVPPGLTGDCLVELSWRIPAEAGLPEGDFYRYFEVGEPWPVRLKTFRIAPSMRMRRSDFLVTRILPKKPRDPARFSDEQTSNGIIYTYRNFPSQVRHPYGRIWYDADAAYVLGFKSFPWNPVNFYDNLSALYLKQRYDKWPGPSSYKKWIKELKREQPPDPEARMTALFQALRTRIPATDLLSPEKKAAIPKHIKPKKNREDHLDHIFDLGYANPEDLGYLLYHAAMKLKIPFKMIFPSSRNSPTFHEKAYNPWLLDMGMPLFEVARGDGTFAYFAPQWQESKPPFIPMVYQGQTALRLDPYGNWRHDFVTLPTTPATHHQQVRRMTTSLQADGAMTLTLNDTGTGQYDMQARKRFFPLPQQERNDHLRDAWAERLRGWTVTNAEVTGAETHGSPIHFSVTATSQLELEGDWFAFKPFPGSRPPLSNPGVWPPNRTQHIVLPHRSVQHHTNIITVPDGWLLKGKPSWAQGNLIGEVHFKASQTGNDITVQRVIVIKEHRLNARAEPLLKRLIAWMDEANNQRIGITRGGAR